VTAFGIDARYDVRVRHLALGVEPLDAVAGGRVAAPLRVLLERVPGPLHRWRAWRPGETLHDVLPGLDRHPSGRFGRCYGPGLAGGTVRFRVVDTAAGAVPPRRVVPRRFEVTLAAEAAVVAAATTPTPHPLFRRVFPVGLFPAASAEPAYGATVVRGRVLGPLPPNAAARRPARWVRVSVADAAGAELGWAHGDDRGEFVLVIGADPDALRIPDSPLPVRLTVSASIPPAAPDPLDPLRPAVDPLWDLPVEPLTATPTPLSDDRFAGRAPLPGQTEFGPFPFDLVLGRERSVRIELP
jgi:hypothetical protein